MIDYKPTIEELCLRYQSTQAGGSQNYYRAGKLSRSSLGLVEICKLTVTDLVRTRDERLQIDGMPPQTVHHDINLLRGIIRVARMEWGAISIPDHRDTFSLQQLPMVCGERDRRLEIWEWEALWRAASDTMRLAMTLAVETAMRRGELCALQWQMICFHTRTISLPREVTKTKRNRKVPMSMAVTTSLLERKRDLGPVLGLSPNAFGCRWKRLRGAAAEICRSCRLSNATEIHQPVGGRPRGRAGRMTAMSQLSGRN